MTLHSNFIIKAYQEFVQQVLSPQHLNQGSTWLPKLLHSTMAQHEGSVVLVADQKICDITPVSHGNDKLVKRELVQRASNNDP